MKLTLHAATDVGMVREKNEDSFWTKDLAGSAVAMVADGMGGAVGGKIASTTAVETAKELLGAWRGEPALGECISNIMRVAHQRIREKGATAGGNLNMGTTCTLAVIRPIPGGTGARVVFGHIGDSKLYQVRRGMVVQRSTDHSMLQRMLDAGAITPEEASNYAHKNIIYKSLGGSESLDLDPPQDFDLDPGDALLLCSDGLSNYVKTDEMARILAGTPSLEKAASYMIDLAKARGGDDNITVALAEYGAYPRDRKIKLDRIRVRRPRRVRSGKTPAVVGLLIVLAVLCSLLAYVLREQRGKSGIEAPQTQPAAEKARKRPPPPSREQAPPGASSEPGVQPESKPGASETSQDSQRR